MCALGALITITSHFCLNTAQYIHIVEYSEFYNGCSRVLEKFARISGVYVHMGIRRSKQRSDRGTIHCGVEFRMVSFFICILVCLMILNGLVWTVVYMQSFSISLWYCLVWLVDSCLC